jgi:PadR family transcriptional regulator PadR
MRDDARIGFLTNWASQARKGTLELVVMSVLARQERYGYDLVEYIRSECGLDVSDGTLYAILARLKAEGFVKHRWEHMPKGPARKYYTLTDGGRHALDGMQAAWEEIVTAVSRSASAR